jgi:hypothetical protein
VTLNCFRKRNIEKHFNRPVFNIAHFIISTAALQLKLNVPRRGPVNSSRGSKNSCRGPQNSSRGHKLAKFTGAGAGSRLTLTTAKEYGENEIRYLCNKFSLPFSDIKTEYREFKDKKGVASALRALMNRVAVKI